MNWLDLLVLIILLLGAYSGFKKGIVFEVAMILGLIVGVYAGLKFSDLLFSFVQRFIDDEGYLVHFISFLIVFMAIVLTFIFFAKIVESVLKVTALNIFNKIAGACFGVFKYAFVISVLFLLLRPLERKLNFPPPEVRGSSVTYPYITKVSSMIFPALDDVRQEFRKRFS